MSDPVIPPTDTAPRLPPVGARSAPAKTAHDFEAVFLGQMTQLMMGTVASDEAFSGGHGEDMFRSVLAEKLGSAIADRGGVGLAPVVMAQIIKMQGGDGNGNGH